MLLAQLAQTSAGVAQTSKRGEKRAALAACLLAADPAERGLCALYLSGSVRQAKLGIGYAQVGALRSLAPAAANSLEVREVDAALERIKNHKGAGSAARRQSDLEQLFGRADATEQRFLSGLILGELRQGALESLVVDAVAEAAQVPAPIVRRAQMLIGSLEKVSDVAFGEGAPGLQALAVALFRPIQPMLAETAADVPDALAQLGRAAFEYKMDGARVQVHRQGEQIRVYTRTLNDVTVAVPEVVEMIAALPNHELILDGEVIALRPDGSPLPFQETMRRFGRRLDVELLRQTLPLSGFFFDCLHCDGRSLLDEPMHERARILAELIPQSQRMPRIVTDDAEVAEEFLKGALGAGHEGVMAKSCDAPYAAGKRGANWLKIKHAHTLDLVVLAAEWGSGRRTGFLSNLHLGARDERAADGFVMLGKTFKGLTDALLRFQTDALLAREVRRDSYTVYVKPELVVEVAFNDIQKSPRYPGGLALRLARIKQYRSDKTAAEADTLDQVRAIYAHSVRDES
jgi:DNA ligase-1